VNYYETMYIINSSLEGNEIQHVKKDVLDYMTSEGADIYSKSDWGRTRLAYDIEKQRYGNYIILRFSSKPDMIKSLNEKFSLMDAVLSHLCIVLDKEPERIEEEIKAYEDKEDNVSHSTKHIEPKLEKVEVKEAEKKEVAEDVPEEEKAVENEEVKETENEEVAEDVPEEEKADEKEEDVAELEEKEEPA